VDNAIATGAGPHISDDDPMVQRIKAIMADYREALALNDPLQQQARYQRALGQLSQWEADEFSSAYASDNAAAAIGRSPFELEARAPVGIQTMAETRFTIEGLRDNPTLAVSALLIIANAINRISVHLPAGLAHAFSSVIYLHIFGEETWISQRARPGGGIRNQHNVQVLGLVYYEQAFSGLNSLDAAAEKVEKRFPMLDVGWDTLQRARARDIEAAKNGGQHIGMLAAGDYCLRAGAEHRASGRDYSPPLLGQFALEKLLNAAALTGHRGRLPFGRLMELLSGRSKKSQTK
jgi:hypothetical protein